jgi:hypothetical protein
MKYLKLQFTSLSVAVPMLMLMRGGLSICTGQIYNYDAIVCSDGGYTSFQAPSAPVCELAVQQVVNAQSYSLPPDYGQPSDGTVVGYASCAIIISFRQPLKPPAGRPLAAGISAQGSVTVGRLSSENPPSTSMSFGVDFYVSNIFQVAHANYQTNLFLDLATDTNYSDIYGTTGILNAGGWASIGCQTLVVWQWAECLATTETVSIPVESIVSSTSAASFSMDSVQFPPYSAQIFQLPASSSSGGTASPSAPLTSPGGGSFIGFTYSSAGNGNSISTPFSFPSVSGYEFTTTDTNLFTAITNFPANLTNEFSVRVAGTNFGTFTNGQICTFMNFLNRGVNDFTITWQNPLGPTTGSLPILQFPLTFTGSNASFNLQFIGQPGPLVILEPTSGIYAEGTNVELDVAALSDTNISYQWQSNGIAITGATNAVLMVTNVQPAVEADYTAVLTDTNGSVTTDPAYLTVATPSLIPGKFVPASLSETNGGFTFQVQLEPNKVFHVESSPDLTNWTTLTNFISTGPLFSFTDMTGGLVSFYRIVSPCSRHFTKRSLCEPKC